MMKNGWTLWEDSIKEKDCRLGIWLSKDGQKVRHVLGATLRRLKFKEMVKEERVVYPDKNVEWGGGKIVTYELTKKGLALVES